MTFESQEVELSRLRQEQCKTRQDEVFGGLSSVERSAYERREARIHELERHLFPQREDWFCSAEL